MPNPNWAGRNLRRTASETGGTGQAVPVEGIGLAQSLRRPAKPRAWRALIKENAEIKAKMKRPGQRGESLETRQRKSWRAAEKRLLADHENRRRSSRH